MPTSLSVINKLKANGWALIRIKGSHHTFKHDGVPYLITVPHPRKDLPPGLLRCIERQSGLKL